MLEVPQRSTSHKASLHPIPVHPRNFKMALDPKIIVFAVLFFGFAVHGHSFENRAASGTQDPTCTLTTNPDISGIGTRVAFYLQGLLTMVGPRFFDVEETENTFRNAFYTSVALMVAAFIYGRAPGSLSLVDGLLVTFLPIVITIGAVFSILTLLKAKPMLKFAYFLHTLLSVVFGLIVWVHVDTYGTTPGCNLNSSVKFVLFGHSIIATSRGLRGYSIFTFAFLGFCLPFIGIYLALITPPTAEERQNDRDNEWLGWVWTGIMVPSWILEVVTIEQIIRRNGFSQATDQWTYGQVFAMILLIGPVFDLGSAIWRKLTMGIEERCPRCSIRKGGI